MDDSDWSAKPPVSGAKFDHFAVAAPRIRDLLPLWINGMGGKFVLGADNPDVGWRTVRLDFDGMMCVELIEPLGGSTFFESFFTARPDGGIHHVTFLVDDLAAAHRSLEGQGFTPFGYQPEFQLFVHPRHANGVLLQVMKSYPKGAGADPGMTLEDVLDGRGMWGTGLASP